MIASVTGVRAVARILGTAAVLSLPLAAGCKKVESLLGAAADTSTELSEAVAETSKAVGSAATEAAAKAGLTGATPGSAPPAASRPKPASAAAGKRDDAAVPATEQMPAAPVASTAPVAAAPAAEAPPPHLETPLAPVQMRVSAAPQPAPALAAYGDRIYSSEDEDVTPAVLLTTTQGGPLFRGLTPNMNTMELVVSAQGRVEQVRLLTPATRMTDMLLLSGAKTWKFAPALKNGHPVRYRTIFSWESTP